MPQTGDKAKTWQIVVIVGCLLGATAGIAWFVFGGGQRPQVRSSVAMVDVGRFDRNLQVPARFGVKTRLKGVPTLLIATPDGQLVNRDDVFATTSASSMTPKSLADYLAKYAK